RYRGGGRTLPRQPTVAVPPLDHARVQRTSHGGGDTTTRRWGDRRGVLVLQTSGTPGDRGCRRGNGRCDGGDDTRHGGPWFRRCCCHRVSAAGKLLDRPCDARGVGGGRPVSRLPGMPQPVVRELCPVPSGCSASAAACSSSASISATDLRLPRVG